jgi:hypothetical protein
MRTAGLLILTLLSACAQIESSRTDSQARPVSANAPPAHYLTCALPSSENKLRCARQAAAACPGGFTISGPYTDLPHLVYACN